MITLLLLLLVWGLTSCVLTQPPTLISTETNIPSIIPTQLPMETAISMATAVVAATPRPLQTTPEINVVIHVEANHEMHTISPLVYGVSAAPGEVLQALHPTLNSWGSRLN